ncbi:MAG: hypothetical protein IKZ62_00895 [Prevotella sp.]|nr:hypothetical protein [Prevotella sp.]
MNKQLKAAGLSGGKVKRKEYLSFLLTIRQEEQVARQNGLRIVSKSVEQIRVMFEREFGSIYHIG